MQLKPTKLALALAGILALTLAGCGGGTSASSTTTTTPTATTSLSGVAATGAAFTDATVTVMDSRGQSVGSGTVGADGTFTITLAAGAVAPFILTATRTSADGATDSLVSVVPTGTGTTAAATVNISPVTNLIASRLSSSGDPTKLGAELAAGTSTVNATTVAAKVVEVQTILAPILTATGTTGTDPLTGTFAADGTGYDRLLDSIKVTITPASATSANIEIGIKQQLAEGTDPTTIQFTSQSTPAQITASVTAVPTISDATLVKAGTAQLITAHLAQLNACFALSTAARVDNANPTGNAVATASSTNIQATQCKDAFIQNAGVISFKSNGYQIGAKSGRPFKGLFYDGGTGFMFSQGAYEFTRANGDIVISYKSKTLAGDETFDTFALRLDAADGKLKQIGNEYAYPGGVSAYHQLRKFITKNQSALDYYSTGYNLNIDHIVGGTGTNGSIFDRVEVTSPKGAVITLKPKAGSSQLQLVKSGTTTNTSFIRLNSVYANTGNTTDPAIKDTTLFFADRTVFTDATIASIPAQSVWKFDYFLAGNAGATANTTQYYKTRARALTIPELKTKGFATLTDAAISAVSGAADITGAMPFSGGIAATLNWTVGAGVLQPTKIQIWGQYNDGTNTGSFNDSNSVGSSVRTGDIGCSSTGGTDFHCVAVSPPTTPATFKFTTTTLLNGSHLWARDTSGREYASFYAMYLLP
jgi:hypothetical protein